MCWIFIELFLSYSILYADIVGFTQLASDCSPKELVIMLNELFGKFDQIAKVSNHFFSSCFSKGVSFCFYIKKTTTTFFSGALLFLNHHRKMNVWESRSLGTVIIVCLGCQSRCLNMPRTVWKWAWTCVKPSSESVPTITFSHFMLMC